MTAGQTARFNAYVALCIEGEQGSSPYRDRTRETTLIEVRAYARSIGIPEDEIAGAVDDAIKLAEAANA